MDVITLLGRFFLGARRPDVRERGMRRAGDGSISTLEDVMNVNGKEVPLGRDPRDRDEAEMFGVEDDLIATDADFEVLDPAMDEADLDDADLDADADAEDDDDEVEMALLQELGIDLDSLDETSADRDLLDPLGEDDPYDDEMAA
ncbi:MAG: hypothetical protein JO034_18450 [Singulisphaera sp.]|nr:hypothetical protein [Singulisphaera sp.]